MKAAKLQILFSGCFPIIKVLVFTAGDKMAGNKIPGGLSGDWKREELRHPCTRATLQ